MRASQSFTSDRGLTVSRGRTKAPAAWGGPQGRIRRPVGPRPASGGAAVPGGRSEAMPLTKSRPALLTKAGPSTHTMGRCFLFPSRSPGLPRRSSGVCICRLNPATGRPYSAGSSTPRSPTCTQTRRREWTTFREQAWTNFRERCRFEAPRYRAPAGRGLSGARRPAPRREVRGPEVVAPLAGGGPRT